MAKFQISDLSRYSQEVLIAQFNLYVHKGGIGEQDWEQMKK